MFHHFCFQWCKNFPKNGELQFSSSSFIFLSLFYHVFYHVSSFLLPVVQKFPKKWKIAIFLRFFSLFYHFFILLSVFIIFSSSGAKIFRKMENCNFPRVFSCFIIVLSFSIMFLSFFIIFASCGAKIFQKNENCNFPRVFFMFLSCFYHFFIMAHHFCFQWCKIFPKNGKLQFSSSFFMFLSFFIIFLSCFIIFASSGAKKKSKKMENCNFPQVFFIVLSFYLSFF